MNILNASHKNTVVFKLSISSFCIHAHIVFKFGPYSSGDLSEVAVSRATPWLADTTWTDRSLLAPIRHEPVSPFIRSLC